MFFLRLGTFVFKFSSRVLNIDCLSVWHCSLVMFVVICYVGDLFSFRLFFVILKQEPKEPRFLCLLFCKFSLYKGWDTPEMFPLIHFSIVDKKNFNYHKKQKNRTRVYILLLSIWTICSIMTLIPTIREFFLAYLEVVYPFHYVCDWFVGLLDSLRCMWGSGMKFGPI